MLVGLLLRNILALKWGFPVLSWIPEGFDATLAEAPVDAARYEAVFESWSTDYGFGFDFTPYFELNVCLYLRELEGLAASITYLEQLNEQIERIFESHINARQKSILVALCREPGALLRIAPHQRAFRIAYGTARADFLGVSGAGAGGARLRLPRSSRLAGEDRPAGGRRGRLGGSKPGCDAPCSILRGN